MFRFSEQRGNSIIEIIVVLVILTVGISGAYLILSRWNTLVRTTENRIFAINIARDWIESVKNIRDTNWIKFSSDVKNCFDVKDYSLGCVWWATPNPITAGSYSISHTGWLFFLVPLSESWALYLDASGLIAHTGSTTPCSQQQTNNCRTRFYRELQITRPNGNIKVNAIVSWNDPSEQSNGSIIQIDHTLTNWKYEQTK